MYKLERLLKLCMLIREVLEGLFFLMCLKAIWW